MTVALLNVGFSSGVDGPGQRMVVYFKGCNLHCPWCAAPESVSGEPQVLYYPNRQDGGELVCPHGAFVGGVRDVARCAECETRDCVASHHPAFELAGFTASVGELVDKAVRYKPFFGAAGGVTIGGGEPTCQFEALRSLLAELKRNGIHTAIETNGTHPDLPDLFDLIDLVYIDLKHPTGSEVYGNSFVHVPPNIARRFKHGGPMIVRIPLVGGFNSDLDTIHVFGWLLSSIGQLTVELLPYHERANAKWRACGLPTPDVLFSVPTPDDVVAVADVLRGYDLTVLP